ncbi:hypothetical protein E3N88_40051 [Mikania micrantha]|uniref:Transposase-associated domain-containing protein n=1 Tax=Mikania micrantha TaxID=192012 RepID=A0A5N6LLN7_9ASTR|nr:hypothetical protein E3N88_40042 [Mikania micrantha]KAD2393074.1 hypothetical protein E3N88_40051 [Mikania micrantha]
MAWFTNRQWMYQRTNSDGFAYSKEGAIDKRVTKHGRIVYDIKCPCFKCQNVFYRSKATIRKHLLGNGFMENYTKWHAHGETSIHDEGQSSTAMEVDDGDDDGYQRMVLDSMPPNYNPPHHANLGSDTLGGHTPNPKQKDSTTCYKLPMNLCGKLTMPLPTATIAHYVHQSPHYQPP